jgi:hypothetical protein
MKLVCLLGSVFFAIFLVEANAENPWGPECKTLNECIALIHAPSLCKKDNLPCRNDEENQALQPGLGLEFEKLGKEAVMPLLEILGTGNALEVARAAEALDASNSLGPEHAVAIQAAWRRMPGSSINMLASSSANPAFAREVMELLRKDTDNGNVAHTFSNFREFPGEVPNGITAAITEHIECSIGQPCNPAFAKLQYEWIDSNAAAVTVGTKLAEALQNTQLDEAGKLAALEFFRSSPYFRTPNQMKDLAIPILREQLQSPFVAVQLQAAKLLTGYRDASGADLLLQLAEDPKFRQRIDALIALAGTAKKVSNHKDRFRALLSSNDMDVRRHSVLLLGAMGGSNAIDDLISQIDAKDWLTTYSAVVALRDYPELRAQKALKTVAESYWHPTVKDAALHVLSIKSNLSQLPKEEAEANKFADNAINESEFPSYERQDFEISNWCKSRFEQDGYRFVPDFITGPEVVEEANNASNHNSTHYKKLLLQREDMKAASQPGLELEIDGWKLKGTTVNPNNQNNYGTLQGQLVAEHTGKPSQVIIAENISAIFLWDNQPYVVTAGLGNRSEGILYRLSLGKNDLWLAESKLRLTGTTQDWTFDFAKSNPNDDANWRVQTKVWVGKEKTIGILGGEGAMIVQPDGSPLWIGCSEPSFP